MAFALKSITAWRQRTVPLRSAADQTSANGGMEIK